jgi:hypothetical protein
LDENTLILFWLLVLRQAMGAQIPADHLPTNARIIESIKLHSANHPRPKENYPLKHKIVNNRWADYLFSRQPGPRSYEVDYRGRGGSLNNYKVSYNPAKERFEGQLMVVPYQEKRHALP